MITEISSSIADQFQGVRIVTKLISEIKRISAAGTAST